MKKSDVGVAFYLLAAIIFFIVPIPNYIIGCYAGDQYFDCACYIV